MPPTCDNKDYESPTIELSVAVEDKIGEVLKRRSRLGHDLRRLVGEEEDDCLVTGLKHGFVFGYRDGKVLGLTDGLNLLVHIDGQ
ncbi:hypothetical protein DVH24_024680 [Malus domestica]|uniref:Uncharacterized protein n=1 Tax=Malus domestica TaxID=3750 RepID=A0A498JIW0_MALDO|nr:hypothetical protein DVH24_024680 [Malus domestica]